MLRRANLQAAFVGPFPRNVRRSAYFAPSSSKYVIKSVQAVGARPESWLKDRPELEGGIYAGESYMWMRWGRVPLL